MSLERLSEAIEEVELPLDGEVLAEGFRLLDRLTAKLTAAVGGFDAAQLWDLDGDTSMTAWLRHHAGMTRREAARVAGTGRRLTSCPVTATAWADGTLTGGQVAAVTANVRDDTVAMYAEHERDLVPRLAALPVTDTGAVMRAWAARAEAVVDRDEPPEVERSLQLSTHLDGRGHLTGDLDPEATAVVATALRLTETRDVEGEPARSPARRRADALVDLCRWYLDHQSHRPGGRHRPHLNVVVDLDGVVAGDPAAAATVDGAALGADTVAMLLCDAGIHRVVTRGGSTILDYGRTTRTVPAPLFNSLVIRDRHCRWPGCDRTPGWCEAHHVVPWEHGGPTRLDNLVVLCTRHHHRTHLPGWRAKLLPDATLEVTTPTGRVLTTHPPPRC